VVVSFIDNNTSLFQVVSGSARNFHASRLLSQCLCRTPSSGAGPGSQFKGEGAERNYRGEGAKCNGTGNGHWEAEAPRATTEAKELSAMALATAT
jgi:hypothetical protein